VISVDNKLPSADKIKDEICEYEQKIRDLQVKTEKTTGTEKAELEREISILKIQSNILRLR
jgi:hypothetical protein